MEVMPEHNVGISLINMPHEVTAGISWCLDVKDIGQVVASCQVMREEVADPELWLHLFMRTCWPPSDTLLGFAEECSGNLAGVDWRARLSARSAAVPAVVVDVGRGYTKYTIVHGVRGRSEPEGAPPTLVQLCSSPTHRPDCGRQEQLIYIHHRLDADLWRAALDPENLLHAAAVSGAELKVGGRALLLDQPNQPFRLMSRNAADDTWEVQPWDRASRRRNLYTVSLPSGRCTAGSSPTSGAPAAGALSVPSAQLKAVRSAEELPLLVGEPFITTSGRRRGEDIGSTDWAHEVRAQLQGRSGPVRLAPQAQISLWAHGIDHGIVVNIGQAQTIALPVVNGELVPGAACASQLGGSALTMAMLRYLNERLPFVDDDLMTWCRDLKETYCYAAPPTDQTGARRGLRERLRNGDDYGVQRIAVEAPGGEIVELAEERVLVPEMFFERGLGYGPTLPDLILSCASRVQQSGPITNTDMQRLLQQVVLVGGGADIPGLRPRTEVEMRSLLLDGMYPHLREVVSPEEVFVLNPPLGYSEPLTSPRFVPLVGGCVRAASSWHFDSTKAQRHSTLVDIPEQRQFSGRIPGWMDRRRLMLAGPSVFRTGGGGGEDDDFWQYLVDQRPYFNEMMDGSSDDGDTSDDDGDSSPMQMDDDEDDESCGDASDPDEMGDRSAEPSVPQASSGKSASKGSNANGANTNGSAKSAGRGGKGAARFFDRVRKGKGKGKGKGKSKAGGKGSQPRRIWRPVNRASEA